MGFVGMVEDYVNELLCPQIDTSSIIGMHFFEPSQAYCIPFSTKDLDFEQLMQILHC